MRQDPIFSGGVIKAALVILVAGALGVGAYILVSGVDINLPDLPDVGTSSTATNLENTTLEETTIGESKPKPEPAKTVQTQKSPPAPPAAGPSIRDLQELSRCTQAAQGDIDKVTTCFDRFNGR